MEATLDKSGRILIPRQVRDDLRLAPGTVLKIEEREGGILLSPLAESPGLRFEDGVLVFAGELEGDIEATLQKDREDRARKLAGLE